MDRMFARVTAAALAAFALGAPAMAQDTAKPAAMPSTMPIGLSEKMFKRMQSSPDAFVEDAAALIYGYGTDAGIAAAGIDLAIAADRAAARGRTMGRMMQADLDGDGTATADEIGVLVQATSAKGRGRVALSFQTADADNDGTVSLVEMQAQATIAGETAVSPGKVAALRGMMALDTDGDGLLTMAEVREVVKRAQDAA